MYQYPANDFDRRRLLLSLMGDFWADIYGGRFFAESHVYAKAQLAAQSHKNLLEAAEAVSRLTVPVYHEENWQALRLRASQRNDAQTSLPKFGTFNYASLSNIRYGIPVARPDHAFPAPPSLRDVRVISNRISESSATFIAGVDFRLEDGSIVFAENPFENANIPQQPVFEQGVVTDQEIILWLYRGQHEWNYIEQHFGEIMGLQLPSSAAYRAIVNALLDAVVEGTARRHIDDAFAAMLDTPLVAADGEIVEQIVSDERQQWVITDQRAYGFRLNATPIVAVGDTLSAGDSLVDTLRIDEFRSGLIPDDLSALAAGKGILAHGFFSSLVFENKTTPLVLETVDGRTKVSFDLGGFPGDILKFWDDVHANGVAAGQTLANLLDRRVNKVGEPQAQDLPATVNPLEFLITNFLRNNAFLVRVRLNSIPVAALGLDYARHLRRVIPPHTTMIVLVELSHAEEPDILDGPGDSTGPGADEDGFQFTGLAPYEESVEGESVATESGRLRIIGGVCL